MKTALTRISQLNHIAVGIQTVPAFELNAYEHRVQGDIRREIAHPHKNNPALTYEQFASVNPTYGQVVCLTVGFIVENADGDPVMLLRSFTGAEKEILSGFSRFVAWFGNTFVHHSNGIENVRFILSRMGRLGLRCANPNFATLNRPNAQPHLDLADYHAKHGPAAHLPLRLVSASQELPSLAVEYTAAEIWTAFRDGEIRLIARYCEWGVAGTLNLLRVLVGNYPAIPCERFYSVEADDEWGRLANADVYGCCPSVWDEQKMMFVSSETIPSVQPEPVRPPASNQCFASAKSDVRWIGMQRSGRANHGI